jgi:anti-sigma factor RsiW
MTCEQMKRQVDARIDGELSSAEAAAFDAHVGGCAECRELIERRRAVSQAVRAKAPRFEAPKELREVLVTAASAPPERGRSPEYREGDEGSLQARPALAPSPTSPRYAGRGANRLQWLAMAASLVIVAVGSWQLATRRAEGALMSEVVLESHVRSLLGDHLTDVTSTDQHTVKPWFNGKLDFSPPVYDFAGKGYPLLGGRLEYLGGKQVAALIYERRKHLINVFLWPTSAGNTSGPASGSMNGYHLHHWSRPDFTYWVASDLGEAELTEFVGLLQGADSAAAL